MISLESVEKEIEELKARRRLTYCEVQYLSRLYAIRDSMLAELNQTRGYHGSEFLELASEIHPALVLSILDEHMDVLKIVHKGEYLSVMNRLRELKKGETH